MSERMRDPEVSKNEAIRHTVFESNKRLNENREMYVATARATGNEELASKVEEEVSSEMARDAKNLEDKINKIQKEFLEQFMNAKILFFEKNVNNTVNPHDTLTAQIEQLASRSKESGGLTEKEYELLAATLGGVSVVLEQAVGGQNIQKIRAIAVEPRNGEAGDVKLFTADTNSFNHVVFALNQEDYKRLKSSVDKEK